MYWFTLLSDVDGKKDRTDTVHRIPGGRSGAVSPRGGVALYQRGSAVALCHRGRGGAVAAEAEWRCDIGEATL